MVPRFMGHFVFISASLFFMLCEIGCDLLKGHQHTEVFISNSVGSFIFVFNLVNKIIFNIIVPEDLSTMKLYQQ